MAEAVTDGMRSLSLDESYLIVVAIDFGTTYSGYAFSFKSKPNDIKMNKNWGAELSCESYKAPTCVMTNPDGSFHSFGYNAENNYNQLDPEEDEIGGPTGYNLYRNFKMLLHSQVVNLSSTVVSTSGHIRKAVDVFAMVLEYLKGHLMNPIKKALKTPPKASDIRWVLTVPAIWNDESKSFMREAAYRAGLISEKNSTKLLIALEPEAASVFCRSLAVNSFACDSTEDLTFRSGEKILIIDAGGGTVDITAHEILLDGNVKEISPPSGGPWGGIKVDKKFFESLAQILGSGFINKFKADRPQQWLQFMTNFERAKKAFIPDGKCSIKIPLPYSFDKDFLAFAQSDIEEVFKKSKYQGIRCNNGYLTVKHEMAKSFFSEPIDHIVNQIVTLLNEKTLTSLNYLLLVGGFGECKSLQDACQAVVPQEIKVLIPVEAQLAVIRGAVMFGHDPMHICSRIVRSTYGIKVKGTFHEGVHNPAKKIVNYRGKEKCKDRFHVLVTKGETIENGATKTTLLYRGSEDETIVFKIFRTDKKDVTYVDEPGVTKVGTAKLHSVVEDCLEVKLTFGHTEMLIEAREKDRGGDFPMKISVDFLSD